ncbi:VanZ family protein [Salinisphaera sp. SPP-AMP-43]|uniref:VanZ family protein n=1 Tax=Salinisphaera sp. SPP-AMP-43 TaxID=3121288 RepID=UPI003C6E4BB0
MPSPPSEPGIPHFDKIEHGGAFLVMGAWFAMLFPKRPGMLLLALSLYAALTEVLQSMTGYRDGDPLDWVADTAGLTLGLVLVHLVALDWLAKLESRVATTRN